ncbi:MAG: MATE family efflux transporter [Holdemania filiformis]
MRAEFTSGKILAPLMKFTVPIMIALILQALYGAVDLLVVGQFASPEAVSAVATGSQVMHSMMVIITGLAMGITVLIGQQFGRGEPEKVGQTVESGVFLFGCLALVLTGVMVAATPALVTLMQAPAEAVAFTNQYVLICSGGILFIAAYNTLGSIFRGLGDARTPLLAVAIACVANIVLDLLFVAGFNMGAAGAALATVIAQAASVVLSLAVVAHQGLPFPFSWRRIRFHGETIKEIVKLGAPVALQDLLVSISFLAITAIVNQLGVIASAGVGVAE